MAADKNSANFCFHVKKCRSGTKLLFPSFDPNFFERKVSASKSKSRVEKIYRALTKNHTDPRIWRVEIKILHSGCLLRLRDVIFAKDPFGWLKESLLGSGCGSDGRAVASDTRDPRFESHHRQNFIDQLSTNCTIEKTKIKE